MPPTRTTNPADQAGNASAPGVGGADEGGTGETSSASHRSLIAAAAAQVRQLRGRSTPQSGSSPFTPDSIPGYQIIREIHRGGQGVVYQAVQKNTQRHVAIKVMRDGPFAGPAELARFEREVQLLGQLDHPNVVGIHDRGVAAGCHYLVMDYIRGQPLDAYLATARPPLEDSLSLFAGICEAVHAAHLRGIIHRDLKPGNIRIDEAGEPHILDFGLARSLWSADGTEQDAGQPMATITGQFVGSIPWASPEQAEGVSSRIDIRTDVYSLGVILYQVLTDRFPYEVNGPVREVLERIISAEPARPSEVAARLAGAPRIDDELDTIVLKALSKAPARRYQGAGELGADIRRYLAGEPIDAKRDSRAYLIKKQLQRHRAAAAVAAGFLLLLVAGLIVSFGLWRGSERHREAAESNLAKAELASAEAAEQAETARQAAVRAERVTELMRQMFYSTDPKNGGDRSLSALEVLNRGADRVIRKLENDPQTQADLLLALGDIFAHMGENQRARELLSRSLEILQSSPKPDGHRIAIVASTLGYSEEDAGNLAAAEAHYRTAYEVFQSRLQPENWHVANGLIRVLRARGDFKGVEAFLKPELERMRVSGADVSLRVIWLGHLAEALDAQERPVEAVPLMREALRLGSDLPPFLTDVKWAVKNNLAWLLAKTGETVEAQQLATEVLEQRRKSLPAGHLDIASSMLVLGTAKLRAGDAAGAQPLLEGALTMRTASLKPDDERLVQARELVDECRRSLK